MSGRREGTGVDDGEVFEAHRGLMIAVAYRMLGTMADAEDAVQDAWLRWTAAPRDGVADPKSYLVRLITNTSLNKLRSVRARREAYVGPWLPEPLLTQAGPDTEERVELAESVSVAMLVVLETLAPEERAVFVLREVFGFSHAEIAAALGRTNDSVRQLAHRAREHVQARRPRFDVDAGQQRQVTQRFLAAAAGGDLDGLMTVLAPDVTLVADGGGKAQAARLPVTGAEKVARLILHASRRPYMGVRLADMEFAVTEINGTPGVVVSTAGRVLAAFTTTVSDGKITAIQAIANPDKLGALATGRTLPL
jgi:RNA polymerase sigma-70 factor (TIGR02957 family)